MENGKFVVLSDLNKFHDVVGIFRFDFLKNVFKLDCYTIPPKGGTGTRAT